MRAQITKTDFMSKLGRADMETLVTLANQLSDICRVKINIKQDRFDIINTMKCLYYREWEDLPENSFVMGEVGFFSFKDFMACPFGLDSKYREYYMLLGKTFGYNKNFEKAKAKKVIAEYQEARGKKVEPSIIYRIADYCKRYYKESLNINKKTFKINFKENK